MITDQDMRDQVISSLGGDARGVHAIVDALQAEHGTVSIETIPTREYWAIVERVLSS